MTIITLAIMLFGTPIIPAPKPVPTVIHLPTLPSPTAPRKPVRVDLGRKNA